jgi:hypothetical protein
VFVKRTRTHVGAAFRHHNPFSIADALMAGMEANARQNPTKQLAIL